MVKMGVIIRDAVGIERICTRIETTGNSKGEKVAAISRGVVWTTRFSNGIEKIGGINGGDGDEAMEYECEDSGDSGDLNTTWSIWDTKTSSLLNCLMTSSSESDFTVLCL